jgi:hypothetical protein
MDEELCRTGWRPATGLPPVWVDLTREPAKLNAPGTQRDLKRFGIDLREGLVLNVWDADGPPQGPPGARDDLVAMGEVYRDAATGEWLLRIIGRYRHESDEASQQ